MIRSGSLEGFDKQVLRLSVNPIYLLQAASINPSVLRDPETLIPYASVAEVLELAADACQLETFGLEMGDKQGLSTLGALGLICSQQPSLGEALSLASKYAHLHAHRAAITLVSYGDILLIRFELDLPQTQKTEQLVQLSLSLIHRVIQTMSGRSWRAQKMLLRQSAPKTSFKNLAKQLNCPIFFDQEFNGIAVLASDLALKPMPDDQLLQKHFQQYLYDLEAKYPNQLLEQIKHSIRSLLPSGECSLKNVAMTLGLQPRVLQKRLQAHHSSFSELLKETRYKLASDYMRSSDMSLTEIALRLGFAELSIFSRSFKLWSGFSPMQWRKRAVNL
jgi:AraC-like DNA-binding protein